MRAFTFQGPPGHVFSIAQDAAGAIGSKLYPGALLLCQYLAHSPLPRGSAVLELGAGACGLPALWLSRCGCRVLATDVPAVLALLDANLAANGGGGGGGSGGESDGGSLQCAPLQWGTEGAGGVAGVGALLQGLGQRLDYIVAADVVYHDEFIAPLLAALLQLTEPPAPAEGAGAAPAAAPWAPPTIILSYVQRFKRARRFFKLAAAHFEVQVLAGAGRDRALPAAPGGGLCVDYDTLTWALPKVLAAGGGGATPHLQCHFASHGAYCSLVKAAAAAQAAGAGGEGGGGAAAAGGAGAGAPAAAAAAAAPAASRHGIDSDSEDEWESSESYARAFAATVGAGGGGGAATSGGSDAELAAACAALGVDVPVGAQAYIYALRRRGGARGGH